MGFSEDSSANGDKAKEVPPPPQQFSKSFSGRGLDTDLQKCVDCFETAVGRIAASTVVVNSIVAALIQHNSSDWGKYGTRERRKWKKKTSKRILAAANARIERLKELERKQQVK